MSIIEEHNVMALLKQLSEALEAEANNGLRQYGVTLSQARLLIELDHVEGGALTFSQLRDILGVRQPTVWGIVSRLQDKGLVSLEQSGAGSRAKTVHIEPAGRDVCRASGADMDIHERRLTACLSGGEVELLESLLQRMLTHFRDTDPQDESGI